MTTTREELDQTYYDMAWEITKRSSKQAAKSLLIGSESLEEMIDRISEAYGLSEQDRRRLRPRKMIDVTDGANENISLFKKSIGVGAGISKAVAEHKKLIELAKLARKHERVLVTAKTLVTKGAKAAGQVAKTGKTAVKANPAALVFQLVYTVGTTGWFAFHAERYNRACYFLLAERLAPEQPVAAGAVGPAA